MERPRHISADKRVEISEIVGRPVIKGLQNESRLAVSIQRDLDLHLIGLKHMPFFRANGNTDQRDFVVNHNTNFHDGMNVAFYDAGITGAKFRRWREKAYAALVESLNGTGRLDDVHSPENAVAAIMVDAIGKRVGIPLIMKEDLLVDATMMAYLIVAEGINFDGKEEIDRRIRSRMVAWGLGYWVAAHDRHERLCVFWKERAAAQREVPLRQEQPATQLHLREETLSTANLPL